MEDDSNSNDVAFNTFIGVVVSVCGNVSNYAISFVLPSLF
jgi:hypothetical protein